MKNNLLQFLKEDTDFLKKKTGMKYIVFLVKHANLEISYLKLYQYVNSSEIIESEYLLRETPIQMTDSKTLKEIKLRINKINELLYETASTEIYDINYERLQKEKHDLENYLSEVCSNGNIKYFENEFIKCKRSVWQAILMSLEEMQHYNPFVYNEIKSRLFKMKNGLVFRL
jgi:hypothetical protein